jgi:tight adherence protein C
MSLPDALDLMVVSVEAGLGLDQAIQYVAKELITTHPDVAQEFQLVNLEIRAGKRRVEALRNLAERTGESELRKLVAILIQTERFGTSIADSLRTHSDFMRVRRRQEAEERANKVGVKLVFPIFFFILPSMLVVSAGPGLLQVFKYLFPLMRGANVGQ